MKKHGYFYTGSGKKKAVEPEQELPEVGSFWVSDKGNLVKVVGIENSKIECHSIVGDCISSLSFPWKYWWRYFKPTSKKYHRVNGVVCVAPESVAPDEGVRVYLMFDFGHTGYVWVGLDWQADMLSRGLVFLSKEDCKENEAAFMKGVEVL